MSGDPATQGALRRCAVVAACLSLVLWPASADAETARLRVGAPIPAWAEPVAVPDPVERPSGGIEALLHDVQWRVEAGGSTRFTRVVYRLCNTSGVVNASELAIDFGSDEKLTFHHVRRTRHGTTVDLLDPASVRTIQPESRLGEGLYDESLSALFFMEDVRVGDTIEYAYSITTPDRSLGGRFAERERLGTVATRLRRLVATWPRERAIRARVHDAPAGWHVVHGETSVRLEARDLEASEPADDVPEWFVAGGFIELSEFATWAEVARWAAPHYVVREPNAALGQVPMDLMRAAGPSDTERAAAALRFVQDEVRYLGLEMGERALVPHPPEVVARRRYGDCKDKSRLLVTILHALGIEADAALVHTTRGHVLGEELPSPLAFNHVVVRARLGGEEVWMDPTRTNERGPLLAHPPLLVERALVARDDATSLVAVPLLAPSDPELEVEEHFAVHGNRASLRVVTIRRGFEARSFRAALEDDDLETIERRYLDFYAARDLEPRATKPLHVEERRDGALVVTEEYHLGRFWVDDESDVSAWPLDDYLSAPPMRRPDAPLWIPFPIHALHRAIVELPEGWTLETGEERVSADAFDLSRDVSIDGTTLTIETRLRTLASHVPAGAVRAFAERARAAEELLAYVVTAPVAAPRAPNRTAHAWFGTMLTTIGVLVIALAMRRRRARPPRREPLGADGESPAQAIPVESSAEAERTHRAPTCCESPIEGGQWTRARLAGDPLFVHSATCPACGKTHRRYYREGR